MSDLYIHNLSCFIYFVSYFMYLLFVMSVFTYLLFMRNKASGAVFQEGDCIKDSEKKKWKL
jgi:hypothetical protein